MQMIVYTILEKVIFRLMDERIRKHICDITEKADGVLFGSKSHDYNSGSVGMEDMFPCGFYSAFTYIYQKLMRLRSLYEADKEPLNESVEDNWMDLLNYIRMSYSVLKFLKEDYDAEEEEEEKEG